MAWHDWGNTPISSTGNAPIAAGSTTALYAQLDSTVLGTVNFVTGQKQLVEVRWMLGADTNVTWQCETATSTALANGVDVLYLKSPSFQSAQYVTQHVLLKDYLIRARQFSTGANGCAFIQAIPLT